VDILADTVLDDVDVDGLNAVGLADGQVAQTLLQLGKFLERPLFGEHTTLKLVVGGVALNHDCSLLRLVVTQIHDVVLHFLHLLLILLFFVFLVLDFFLLNSFRFHDFDFFILQILW